MRLVGCSISRPLESTNNKDLSKCSLESSKALLALGLRQVSIYNNPVLNEIRKVISEICSRGEPYGDNTHKTAIIKSSIDTMRVICVDKKYYTIRFLRGPFILKDMTIDGSPCVAIDIEQMLYLPDKRMSRRRVRIDYCVE